MSSTRKSARTPRVSEKVKESAASTRAALPRGKKKQAAPRASKAGTPAQGGAVSSEEEDLRDDEGLAGSQEGGTPDPQVDDAAGTQAAEDAVLPGEGVVNPSPKRRRKDLKKKKVKKAKKATKESRRVPVDLTDEDGEDGEMSGWRARDEEIHRGRSKPSSDWPGDEDLRFEDDDWETGQVDDPDDDVFELSAELLVSCAGLAIFASVLDGVGRDALPGNIFLVLHGKSLGMAKDGIPVSFFQVAPVPIDCEGWRRAAKVATSVPNLGDPSATRDMVSSEVTYIDFGPDTKLSFVSVRGWAQAKALGGSQLRFAHSFTTSFVAFVAPKAAAVEEAPGPGVVKAVASLPLKAGTLDGGVGSSSLSCSLDSLSCVPVPSELKEAYRQSSDSMYRVAPSVIAQAAAMVKESSKTVIYDRATRKREESTQAGKTMVKLGASSYLLDVISVAAAEIFVMPLSTVSATFHHRRSCPVNMVVMASFVSSWKLPDSGKCLAAFANLSRVYGPQTAVWRGREYSCLQEVEVHSETYLTLFAGHDGKIFGADVAVAKEACMNLLLLIFMLTGMRYSLQWAMIQAVERAFKFIRANDFGIYSSHSPVLIRAVLVELFVRFDELRTQILSFRGLDEAASSALRAELISKLGSLPYVASDSETGLIVERLRLGERDTKVSFLMNLNSIAVLSPVAAVPSASGAGSPDLSSVGDGNPKRKKKNKGSKSSLAVGVVSVQQAAGPASGQVGPAAVVVVGQAAGAAGTGANGGAGPRALGAGAGAAGGGHLLQTFCGRIPMRSEVNYCISSLSQSGCQFAANNGGRACRWVHRIPARAHPDYAIMAAKLAARGLVPSAGFTSAV